MDKVYKWKPRAGIKIDAQEAGKEFERIRDSYGSLSAPLVVKEASSIDSPLHDAFEWSDDVAAHKFREDQARHLLRHIVITVVAKIEDENPEGKEIRAFVPVIVDEETKKTSYESIQTVMESQTLRVQVLERAYKELQSWTKRYKEYEEFAELFASIERIRLQDLVRSAESVTQAVVAQNN